MGMAVFEATLGIYQTIIQILIYIAVAILLLTSKGNERVKNIVIMIGFFTLDFFIQNFFVSSTYIMLWLLFTGVKFFVSRELLIGLILLMLVLGFGSPFFYIIALILNIIVLVNFFFSTFRKLNV